MALRAAGAASGSALITAWRAYIAEHGGPPKESRGNPGEALAVRIRKAKEKGGIFTTSEVTELDATIVKGPAEPVSYTHLTLPTNREV